jgi:Ca-activated chloride channel family protein
MKQTAILGLLLLLAAPAMAQESGDTIDVKVKLVNVFTTVADEHGAPVAGLSQDNFQIFEDGKPQKIALFSRESAIPLSILLAIDTSLSTRKDLPLELSSARRFAHDIVRPIDGLSVYEFNENVNEVIPFTSDLKRIDHAIEHLQVGAATALYDAIYLGSQALDRRQGRKVMVVITDGGDTVSQASYKDAVQQAQDAEAVLYSIIVVPIEANAGRDTGGEHALIQLSADTGGRYFYASSLAQLDKAFQQISEELRTQYLLAYYPIGRSSDSAFRKIDVQIRNTPQSSQYTVRHRTGYFIFGNKR